MFEVNLCLALRLLYAISQQRFVCNFLCGFFSLSSPQWSATSAQIPSGEFFHHSSPLVRATAAAGWPYPRLRSVLPESGWSRKPTESTYPLWSQILWIMGFLGKHFVLELLKNSFRWRTTRDSISCPLQFRERSKYSRVKWGLWVLCAKSQNVYLISELPLTLLRANCKR